MRPLCGDVSYRHITCIMSVLRSLHTNVDRAAPSTIDIKQILLLLVHPRQTSIAYTDHILLNFSYLHIIRNKLIHFAASCYTLYISITQSSPLLKKGQLLSSRYIYITPLLIFPTRIFLYKKSAPLPPSVKY